MAKERDLDVLVAEHVLGHQIIRQKKGGIKERTKQGHLRPLRAYSTEIAAAWEVVQQLNISLLPVEGDNWFAIVGESWKSPAAFLEYLQRADFVTAGASVAKPAALSICIAALKAAEKRLGQAIISQAPVEGMPVPTVGGTTSEH